MANTPVMPAPFLTRLLGLDRYDTPRPARRAAGRPVAAGPVAALQEGPAAVIPSVLRPDFIIALVREGLPARSFAVLCDAFRLPKERMAEAVSIAPRTLARRKLFKPDESERILRVGRVFQSALNLFEGDEDAAREWMLKPAFGLGGAVPLDYAGTEPGALEVERLLGRIEHGIVA